MARLNQPAMRWAVGAAVAAVLGCGLFALVPGQPAQEQQLADAESRWAQRPFSHYQLVVAVGAACELGVEVRDERAIQIFHPSSCGYPARTVKDLFDMLKRNKPVTQDCTYFRCACRQSIDVYANYDEQWGYPRRVAVWLRREANLQHPDFWRYLLTAKQLPSCARVADVEIVRVVSLTPLP
jgi:Family of unknown function (DUF6174)